MAKNAITVIDEGIKALDALNNKLLVTEKNILKVTDAFLKADNKSFFNNKIPNDVNNSLKTNKTYINQINIELKERQRLEKALATQLERNKQIGNDLNAQLAKERFETQALNRANKEAAILSSSLATAYQKLVVKMNQASTIVQSLNAKKLQGIKLSKLEIAQLKKSEVEFARYQKAVLGADASVGRFQRNVGNYPKALGSAAKAARSLAGAMGLLGGAFLVVRVFTDAFKRIREFDKEMQNMAGIMRTTRPELKEIENQIIKVASVSIKTSNDVAKLATALFTLGKTKEEVLDLLEPTNNLAIALGATSEEAGEFLVQTLNAFNKSSASAAEFADTIAGIRANTTLDFQKMRDSFQYIAPISRLLGKDLAYTGAIVGVLADNSIKAEQAGRLLGTAQIKLATANKTLDEALQEINQAYKDGKTEIEILAIAGDLFGKQAAKIGAILATNIDTLSDYEKQINASSGALDDLVNEQLKSVDAQLKITTSTWEQFVLSVENGEGSISTALGSVLGFVNSILKGLTLMNKTNEEYAESLAKDIETNTLKELAKTYKEMGADAKELAINEADRARDSVDSINKEIEALKEKNKQIEESKTAAGNIYRDVRQKLSIGLLSDEASAIENNNKKIVELSQSLGYYNGVLKASEAVIEEVTAKTDANTDANNEGINSTIRTVKFLKEQIQEQKKLLEVVTSREEAKVIQDTITELEKELEAILGSTEARKKSNEAIKGSIVYHTQLISKLEEQQGKLATNSREWSIYSDEIDKAKQKLADLKIEFEGLNLKGADAIGLDKIIDDFNNPKEIEGLFTGEDEIKDLTERLKKAQEIELDIARETADLKKKLEEDVAAATVSIMNSVFDGKIMRYEEDIQQNNDYYAALLDNESLSEEQRSALEAERDRKNAEIEKKKREVERKAAIYNKVAALTEVAIDTAKKVSFISAQAAVLAANPLTAPLAAQALAQIPLVIGSGALAAATIAARPIPKYEKGKSEYDNYEGTAIWGEKRQEIKLSKDGNIELSPSKIGNHLTHVKKDDIIIPDASKYLSNLSDKELYENIHKHAILSSISQQSNVLNSYLITQSFEKSLGKHSDKMIKAFKENRPKVNLYNNNNISEDLGFLIKKNNTL